MFLPDVKPPLEDRLVTSVLLMLALMLIGLGASVTRLVVVPLPCAIEGSTIDF